MEKAGKGELWNTGLLEHRITPISVIIPSPLEMMIQKNPRTILPQLPSNIGKTAHNVHNMHNEIIKLQGNSTEVGYSALEPGTLVCGPR